MRDDNNPAITAWLKQQADRGARIIGICVGALVVGRSASAIYIIGYWSTKPTCSRGSANC